MKQLEVTVLGHYQSASVNNVLPKHNCFQVTYWAVKAFSPPKEFFSLCVA